MRTKRNAEDKTMGEQWVLTINATTKADDCSDCGVEVRAWRAQGHLINLQARQARSGWFPKAWTLFGRETACMLSSSLVTIDKVRETWS